MTNNTHDMDDGFYSLEMLAMAFVRRYEGPEGSLERLFRERRRDTEVLCAILFKLEDEENQ